MVSAVLFDLDNTLIRYDEPAFLRQYFAALGSVFEDLIPPDALAERVMMSTVALSANDGTLSNADYFMNTFLDPGADRDDIWNRFLTFYQTAYRELRPECVSPDDLPDLFARLRAAGVRIVLATNPIYPLAAYTHRLSWADLTVADFDHITHIENSGFTKPNAGYFRQITEHLGVDPASCIMVGNDPFHDVAAANIGMRTYLTTDAEEAHYVFPGIPTPDLSVEPDKSGAFSGLMGYLDTVGIREAQ